MKKIIVGLVMLALTVCLNVGLVQAAELNANTTPQILAGLDAHEVTMMNDTEMKSVEGEAWYYYYRYVYQYYCGYWHLVRIYRVWFWA